MALPEEHVYYIINPHNNTYKQDHWDEKKEIKITIQDNPLIHLYDHRKIYNSKVTLTFPEYLELLSQWKNILRGDSDLPRSIDLSSKVHLRLHGNEGSHLSITDKSIKRPPDEYLPFNEYRKLIKKQTFVILSDEFYQLFRTVSMIFHKVGRSKHDLDGFYVRIGLEDIFKRG